MYIQHSLIYAVRNFHLNWLTFLEAMTDVLGVHFLSGHSVQYITILAIEQHTANCIMMMMMMMMMMILDCAQREHTSAKASTVCLSDRCQHDVDSLTCRRQSFRRVS